MTTPRKRVLVVEDTALQRDLPPDVEERLWSAVEELDSAIAALRSVVFPA